MAKKRVRIKDIAIAAGVSTGTVDRVIHNRGNVLPKVKKRVEEVMKTLDYQPNLLASTLANNKVLKTTHNNRKLFVLLCSINFPILYLIVSIFPYIGF